MKKVAIIMGSDSDLPIVKKAAEVLKDFGVSCEMRVLSAHRCAADVSEFASNAEENGFGVIIAAAGKAAHLAGAIAGQTPLPVIGIPIKASALEGIDALLSTVQMPAGVPVATVAIDGAANAAYLAVQILAVGDDGLMAKMKEYRAKQTAKVLEADKKIREEYSF
ncbi:MAG: 5-(carboxyamino)imidazole ribonucleotide mutase [Ruminiclostridium sp.]|nr:5-(carboxyamino)imidazole ribonucleotide mutase [Ruminiclostridium sp.]